MIPALQVTGYPTAAPQNAEGSTPLDKGGFEAVFGGGIQPDNKGVAEATAAVVAEVESFIDEPLTNASPAIDRPELVELEEPGKSDKARPENDQEPEVEVESLLSPEMMYAPASALRASEPADSSVGRSQVEGSIKGAVVTPVTAPAATEAPSSVSPPEGTQVRMKSSPHRPEGLLQREALIFTAIQVDETQAAPEVSSEEPAQEVQSLTDSGGYDLSDRGRESGAGGSHTGLRSDRVQGAFAASGPVDGNTEQAILRQLADVLTESRPAHEPAEISLTARELGRLSMVVAQDGGAVTVTLTAERPETLDLLRRNIDLLARDLRDLGFDSLNFSFQQDTRDRADRATADPVFERATAPDMSMPELHHPLTQTIGLAARTTGGLDLRL